MDPKKRNTIILSIALFIVIAVLLLSSSYLFKYNITSGKISYSIEGCEKEDQGTKALFDEESLEVKRNNLYVNIVHNVEHFCGQDIKLKEITNDNIVSVIETFEGEMTQCKCQSIIKAKLGPLESKDAIVKIFRTSGESVETIYDDEEKDNNILNGECNQDSDCAKAGCSSQLCVQASQAQDIVTTCEYKEEYGCYQMTDCGCVDNKCMWKENTEFLDCLKQNI